MNKRTRYLAAGTALLIGLFVALALILTASQSARAAGTVRYAAPNGLSTGSCESWANACTLQRALDVAVSGDEIWVKEGVHYPGTTRTAAFALKSGVALYGGFAGTETSRDQRDWQTNVTVLSGDIDGNDLTDPNGVVTDTANIRGDNAYHVISSTNVISTAVLDGFFITAGQANGSYPHNCGGGVFNQNSSLTLTNVTFSGNSAEYGGGMYNAGGISASLTNVTFRGNSARYGGGLDNDVSGVLMLANATFSGNSATNLGGGMFNVGTATLTNVTFSSNTANWGGGMSQLSRPMTLNHATFSGNRATERGGGMYLDGDLGSTLTDVTFSGNSAYNGGGMYNKDHSSPMLTDVTFSGNTASYAGGGMYNYEYSNPVLTDVTFISNTATSYGGGMNNKSYSSPTLTNVTFIRNTAGNAGGMFNESYSNPTLMNVTFSSNSATADGGGMYNHLSSSPVLTNVTFSGNTAGKGGGMYNNNVCTTTLVNVIVWGNNAATGPEFLNDNSTPLISYSDIRGCGGSGSGWQSACGTDGGGNIDADPRFVDAANGNLRLLSTSPAIDAGNNAAVPAGVTTDLDGNPRFVDIPTVPDTGSGTPPIVDMGAYEAQVNVTIGKAVSPPTVAPGQTITFTLTVANPGGLPATGIVITDTLPAILTNLFFTSTLSVTDTGYVPPYVWTVQDLAPGQGGIITVSGMLTVPLAAGVYTNTAVITATGDLVTGNNTAVVTFTVANVAPAFTSAPVVTATQDVPYIYTAVAADDNGDALTITAPALPAWLTLTDHGDGTATLSGTPTDADVGDHPVVLRVTDRAGAFTEQVFTITVAERPRYYIFLPLVLRNAP